MKFTLISDVHIDLNPWDWNLLKDCDPLIPMVVAGDISNDIRTTTSWLETLKTKFENIVWVSGNHDSYKPMLPSSPKTVQQINNYYAGWSRNNGVCYLDKSSVVVAGIRFVGCTGWHDFVAGFPATQEYQMKLWRDHTNDSKKILWSTTESQKSYEENALLVIQEAIDSANAVNDLVKSGDIPTVVVTHHLPNRKFCVYKPDPDWNALNGVFVNTLFENIENENIKVWCFGHTHSGWDVDLNGIRYICNPRGYRHEEKSWSPIVVEL